MSKSERAAFALLSFACLLTGFTWPSIAYSPAAERLQPPAQNAFGQSRKKAARSGSEPQSFVAPDLWYDTLEYPDMRNVSLYGSVRMRTAEEPAQPEGVWTGFTSVGGMRPAIVNGGAECHSGTWCARADLTTQSNGTIMLEAGYGALEPIGSGNMVYSNQRHQFYRAWMKWPANFSLPRGCLGKLIYMRNTCPKQPCGAVLVRFESAGNGLAVDVENTYPSSTSPTKSQIKFDGRWHSIEAELDPAHSHINMWIDGNRVVNWNTPIRGNTPDWVINDTKYGMYINPVENHGCHPPKSESFWVDDMAQSTRRIGP